MNPRAISGKPKICPSVYGQSTDSRAARRTVPLCATDVSKKLKGLLRLKSQYRVKISKKPICAGEEECSLFIRQHFFF